MIIYKYQRNISWIQDEQKCKEVEQILFVHIKKY